MTTDLHAAGWLVELGSTELRQIVGPGAFGRGSTYAKHGYVHDIEVDDDTGAISATVDGSRRERYRTTLTPRRGVRGRATLSGTCSCPMSWDCKHVAAVGLTVLDQLERARRAGAVGADGYDGPAARARASAHVGAGWPHDHTGQDDDTDDDGIVQLPSLPALASASPAERAAQLRAWANEAGLAISAVNASKAPPPTWESALSMLRYDDTGGSGSVALEFALGSLSSRFASTAGGRWVTMRSLRLGASGKWIKTGATFAELARPGSGVRLEQRTVLTELLDRSRASSQGRYGDPLELRLDALGPSVWGLLRQAEAAGIALLHQDRHTVVSIADQPWSVTLDVTRDEDDDSLVLTPTIHDETGAAVTGEVTAIGSPVHGMATLRAASGAEPDRLLLAELQTQVPASVESLVRSRQPLRVPPADQERFLAEYYPALSRRIAVRSVQGGLELPTVVPPRVALQLTVEPEHKTRLTWGFAYGEGESRRFVTGDTSGAVYRDPAAEADVMAELPTWVLDELPSQVRGGRREPTSPVTLAGIDTARFVSLTLPRLRAVVDVAVEGELADYAEADEAPVIHVSTTDSDQAARRDWFGLQVRVSVEGADVPLPDLIRALSLGDDHLLLDNGTWFTLDRPELDTLRRLLAEAADLTDNPPGELSISRLQVGLWEELVALGVVEEQSRRWAQSIAMLTALTDPAPIETPTGLLAELRHYQDEGYRWLSTLWDARLGGILADDMGLGKTMQVLATIQRGHERDDLAHPVLVVAPTSVIGTWVQEAKAFTPELRVVAVTETARRVGAGHLARAIADADVVVTSYTLLRLDEQEYGDTQWRAVVLDEAQFVKNHRSKTYRAVRTLDTEVTFALSGTPLENSLMDLWSLLSATSPGLFPNPDAFTTHFRKPIEAGSAEVLASLRGRLRPFVLRRTKDQVASDLPPKQEQVLTIPLAPGHQRVYDRHLQRERQRVLGLLGDLTRNRVAILAGLTRLRQLALDPALIEEDYDGPASAKVDVLVEQLRELAAEGHRALVFSQFTRFLGRIRTRLEAEGISTVYLDGRTKDRAARIEEFRTGDAPAFLISLKAGGFGLTLTEADYVYVMDPWWNPAAEAQAVDRTHRIGQDKPVMVYRLISAGTIEEKVRELQVAKQGLFDAVVDEGALLSKALGASEIRDLLTP